MLFYITNIGTKNKVLTDFKKNCQPTLAGFPENMPTPPGNPASDASQRAHNEKVRLYAITFLPPGRFLLPVAYLPDIYHHRKMGKSMHLYNRNKALKIIPAGIKFSPRKEKHFSSQGENFIFAKIKTFCFVKHR